MLFASILAFSTLLSGCKKKADDTPAPAGTLKLYSVQIGTTALNLTAGSANTGLPLDAPVQVQFISPVDTAKLRPLVSLTQGTTPVPARLSFSSTKQLSLQPADELDPAATYTLQIGSGAFGQDGKVFGGAQISFTTLAAGIVLDSAVVDRRRIPAGGRLLNVALTPTVVLYFNRPVAPASVGAAITATNSRSTVAFATQLSADGRRLTLTPASPLQDVSRYILGIPNTIKGRKNEAFAGGFPYFYTQVSTADKFPRISDDALMDLVQSQTLKYFTDGADPTTLMAKERNAEPQVTTGGGGFGIMALIVGAERGFITRTDAVQRWDKITRFLKKADRFHGAWPHWITPTTGHVLPFGTEDNGGDLVETSFMAQGLITVRQYLNRATPAEAAVAVRIDSLLDAIEWDWYRQEDQKNVLYWHWSPNYAWIKNFPLHGWNETMITYVMAATSRTHTIPRAVYDQGYCTSDRYLNGRSYYGVRLPLGPDGGKGGPLFFTHYNFLGLDPRNLRDAHAYYWEQDTAHTAINYRYCVANPKGWPQYGPDCWGLTASDNDVNGYSAHDPDNDLGVISPTAALSSMPYKPAASLRAMRFFYYKMGDRLFGPQGFYDAYDPNTDKVIPTYLAIDQGPIVVMIENYRTGLLWRLFMSAPEVRTGLTNLGFTY